jgi:hypothetical protein
MYNAYSFTSIVGLPRESKILRAKHFRIGIFVAALQLNLPVTNRLKEEITQKTKRMKTT